MNTSIRILIVALGLWGGVAVAARPAQTFSDQTTFKVRTASGVSEVVKVEDLKVGETRSLRTERGTPVVVGRHEKGYVLDVAGERIEVESPQVLMVDGDGPLLLDGGDGRQVVLKTAKSRKDADGADASAQRKVMVIKRSDQSPGSTVLSGSDAEAMIEALALDQHEPAEGQRVTVVRRIEKRTAQE